ncbi:YoaK family protein [Gracilibacillus sp. S3-1-1]|uniref:YoaK family protein n=1 Tax=Gracilibacillus pellucidus TaxID=3095368 RepID=A0ACC6M5P4_9BACI|nr:YoaK family protein [Gracilibacillus sp. S3-1-1]MDX8046201.1 YoaK family protein [Gracilibacillus sp. S3-1-1]
MKQDIDQNRLLTILTIFSTFLMGFIDAFTFITQEGLFASAQTGNVVMMAAKLFAGNPLDALINVSSFVGFSVGAFLAQGVIERLKEYGWKKYRIYLFIQMIFLLVIAIIQQHIGSVIIGFMLGLLAGYELTVFRKIKSTNINNGIMTGNTKNLMNNLYLAIFNKDKAALHTFSTLLLGIGIFILGVGTGTIVLFFGEQLNLWLAFILTGIFYVWLWIKRA